MNINKLVDNIFKDINKDIVEILETSVTDVIEDVQVEVVEDHIYGRGEPKFYERRGEDKGLIDKEKNMNGNVISNTGKDIVYVFENDTKTNPYEKVGNTYLPIYEELESDESLLEFLDSEGIDISELTLQELNNHDLINKTIKQSLKAKGYKVK